MESYCKAITHEGDMNEFFLSLSKVPNRKPALLSLLPTYSDRFSQSAQHLPTLLQGRYCPENGHLNYSELLEKNKNICCEPILESQVKHLEEITRGQASNKQWFKFRAGRITASQLYQVNCSHNFFNDVITCMFIIGDTYQSSPAIYVIVEEGMLSRCT